MNHNLPDQGFASRLSDEAEYFCLQNCEFIALIVELGGGLGLDPSAKKKENWKRRGD